VIVTGNATTDLFGDFVDSRKNHPWPGCWKCGRKALGKRPPEWRDNSYGARQFKSEDMKRTEIGSKWGEGNTLWSRSEKIGATRPCFGPTRSV
jgi:hypothetical protein